MKASVKTWALRTFVAGVSALSMAPVFAWGESGHRITGLVAQQMLTPEAAAGVKALMGKVDLADFSLYMDRDKAALDKRIPGSRRWHYDDRPVCDAAAQPAAYCADGNCASVQITQQYRTLIDTHASPDEKRLALLALVHLVGDIHQPLHASDHDDRGGNDVHVSFTAASKRTSVNLHSAWDTALVKASFTATDERVIAQQLVAKVDAAQARAWQSGAAASWLAESYQIAQEVGYGKLPGFSCKAQEPDSTRLDLDDEYVQEAVKIIPTQLTKAGMRIAAMLNRAFAQ